MGASFKILLFEVLLITALPIVIFSQVADIKGIVADSTTKERLPYANVTLRGTTIGTAANAQGFFLIPSVPWGVHELVVSYVGYAPQSKTVLVVEKNAVTVNFLLQEMPLEAAEVQIIGESPDKMRKIATSFNVVTQTDIKRVPVAGSEDLFRSMMMLPSLVSTSDVSSQFYARGGAGDQNLILLDGMKIYNPYHAFGVFSVFDPNVIRTAEVYIGAFPPGYGDRLSSVVNVLTRAGRSDRLSGRASLNFLSGEVNLEGPTFLGGGTTWVGSARRSFFDKTLTRFLGEETPLSFYDMYLKLTFPGQQEGLLSFQGFFSGDDLRDFSSFHPDYHWKTAAFAAKASGLISDRLYAEGTVNLSTFDAMVDPKGSSFVKNTSTSVNDAGVRASLTAYSESGDFYIFGFEISFPTLEYSLVNRLNIPIRLYAILPEANCWIRYQTNLDPIMLDAGLHIDFASPFVRRTGIEAIQPRINASYSILNDWKLKASYGRVTQHSITVNNEDDVISIFDARIALPEGLPPEIADHYVIGVSGNVIPEMSIDLQTYYKHFSSLFTYNRDKVDALDPDYLQGKGQSYGAELIVRLKHGAFDYYAAYSLGSTRLSAGRFEYAPRYDRRHSIKTLIETTILQGLTATLRWEFGSGYPFTQSIGFFDRLTLGDPFRDEEYGETGTPYIRLGARNEARLPSYHRADIGVTCEFSIGLLRGFIGVSIINLYNSRNLFYFDRKTGRRVDMLPLFPSVTAALEY